MTNTIYVFCHHQINIYSMWHRKEWLMTLNVIALHFFVGVAFWLQSTIFARKHALHYTKELVV
jgi:hypothetical protein